MKSFLTSLCVASYAFHEGSAFSVLAPSRYSSSSSRSRPCSPTSLSAAVVGSSSSNNVGAKRSHHTPATTIIQQREMDTIRKELILKYITLGHSEEYATREVNYFLEDAERSQQYVEMRRIAMARGNDLGIENIVQFAAAFLVGLMGSWALDSWHTFQTSSPDGSFPWMS